jgi:hypothetical protein
VTRRAIYAWPGPSALLRALGAQVVEQKAIEGDMEAQFSQGGWMVNAVAGAGGAGLSGAAGSSPQVEVGLAVCTFRPHH